MFNEVTILAQTALPHLLKKKFKQVNIKMNEAHRRGWEINKILSRLLQTMPCGRDMLGVGDRKTYVPST